MKSLKRKRGDGGEESDEDTNGIAPPINDIYRTRQQKESAHNIIIKPRILTLTGYSSC